MKIATFNLSFQKILAIQVVLIILLVCNHSSFAGHHRRSHSRSRRHFHRSPKTDMFRKKYIAGRIVRKLRSATTKNMLCDESINHANSLSRLMHNISSHYRNSPPFQFERRKTQLDHETISQSNVSTT